MLLIEYVKTLYPKVWSEEKQESVTVEIEQRIGRMIEHLLRYRPVFTSSSESEYFSEKFRASDFNKGVDRAMLDG